MFKKFTCVLMPAAAAQDGNGQKHNFTVDEIRRSFPPKEIYFYIKSWCVVVRYIIDTLLN